MGADVIRWLYCRHNPAGNINFGPGPAEELRSKFILKLWNTYAFFCNYARLDGFDPAAPQVPVDGAARHRSLDSVRSATAHPERHARRSKRSTCMAFCLEAEEFVDDKLQQLVRPPQSPPLLEERTGGRQAGRVSDAVHRAGDADEAAAPRSCRS